MMTYFCMHFYGDVTGGSAKDNTMHFWPQKAVLPPKTGKNQEKMHFFEKFLPKCLQVQKKAVPLHRF